MKKRVAAVAVLLILLLSLCGCGKADLYGSWRQESAASDGESTRLTFFDNGTGTVTQGDEVTWLYYKVKGDTVTVTMNEVGAEATDYTFSVKDDVLTLTDESGAAVTLCREVNNE